MPKYNHCNNLYILQSISCESTNERLNSTKVCAKVSANSSPLTGRQRVIQGGTMTPLWLSPKGGEDPSCPLWRKARKGAMSLPPMGEGQEGGQEVGMVPP